MKKLISKNNKLESFWNNPILHPNYLDNKNVNPPVNQISVVVATYNRAPYPPSRLHDNPLSWALSSILSQKKCNLGEIIIIDDGSFDYTEKTVNYYRKNGKQKNIEIKYIKNKKNEGLPSSLNKGIENSKFDYVFFMDDDCILSNYSLFGALYSMNKTNKSDNNIALMHIPVYTRTNLPLGLIPIDEIGKVDFENTTVTNNNHLFPEEYLSLSKNVFLDDKLKILKPIEIHNIGGIYLIKKDIFKEAGGICEYFKWPNFYGEQTDFSLKLNNLGYNLYLTPDPKFSCIHLKYGCSGKINFFDIETSRNNNNFGGHSLEEIVKLSSIPKRNSGCRVNTEDWSYSKIISHYIIFSKWDKEIGQKWKTKIFREFVEQNLNNFSAPIGKKIMDKKKREEIWKKAIIDGDNLLKKINLNLVSV